MHDKDYIHRDLKPENCVIGLESNENVIYLIDFGLSRKYRDSRTNEHIPYKEGNLLESAFSYFEEEEIKFLILFFQKLL